MMWRGVTNGFSRRLTPKLKPRQGKMVDSAHDLEPVKIPAGMKNHAVLGTATNDLRNPNTNQVCSPDSNFPPPAAVHLSHSVAASNLPFVPGMKYNVAFLGTRQFGRQCLYWRTIEQHSFGHIPFEWFCRGGTCLHPTVASFEDRDTYTTLTVCGTRLLVQAKHCYYKYNEFFR